MYPYISLGSFHIGTFGLLLWLAAVCATIMLHRNFMRNGVNADALNVVAMVVVAGILGAKAWHELQNPAEIVPAIHSYTLASGNAFLGFLAWFQAGFAWYGGLLAGVVMLMIHGVTAKPNGLQRKRAAIRMLDLAAPAAAVGYGVGRIGCLTSGDGDYGKNTTLAWGVHMAHGIDKFHRALVVPTPPDTLVQPTPIYEFIFAMLLAWWLWNRGRRPQPLGLLTGEYLVISGIGRFLVEFVRINPPIYAGMSNAQVAAIGSVVFGAVMMLITRNNERLPVIPQVLAEPANA